MCYHSGMDTTREPVTNGRFAALVGVHFTMASRYRNGQRIPSTRRLHKIATVFDLPIDQLVAAANAGGAEFGHYMRIHVFGADPMVDGAQYKPQEVIPPCLTPAA